MEATKTYYMYLYDLPKDRISSVRIALAFKEKGIDIGLKRPFIQRHITKPFYTAILHIPNAQMFELSKQKMRYFEIDHY